MTQVFVAIDVPHNSRENSSLALPKAKATSHGMDTIRFIGKTLWQRLSIEMKEPRSLEIFNQKLHQVGTLIAAVDCI